MTSVTRSLKLNFFIENKKKINYILTAKNQDFDQNKNNYIALEQLKIKIELFLNKNKIQSKIF